MIRKIAFALILAVALLAIHPMLSARTIEEKDEADPVALLRKKQQDVREKELKDIDKLRDEVIDLETRIRTLNQRLLAIRGSDGTTPGMLDEMHELVNRKEGLEKELKEKEAALRKKKDEAEKTYVASETGEKFHRQSCIIGKKIPREKRVYFKGKKAALDEGYNPCKVCHPEEKG